jgi:hypothetical protein
MSSVLYENEIYITGWLDSAFYKYTPATDQWTQLADTPYEISACGLGIINNLIYCMGGNASNNSEPEYKSIIVYNITANSWTLDTQELTDKRHWMATAHYKGGLYALGGMDTTEFAVDIVEEIVPQGTSDVNNESGIPEGYSLMQNYPNPFNPETKIEFRISDLGFVSLKVYDILGNEIATLVNEDKPAGKYEVTFDASGLTSGIYFYTLRTGNTSIGSLDGQAGQVFSETKKMILLR